MVTRHLIANWRELPTGAYPRLGVITSRKIGNAVARSRARRLMREVFRKHRAELLPPADMVLIARPALTGKTYAEVERDYLHVLKHAHLIKSP